MRPLRLLVVFCLAGAGVLVLARCSWQGRLSHLNQVYLVDLGRAPLWDPPSATYATFQHQFSNSTVISLPPEGTPGITIDCTVNWELVLLDCLRWIWLIGLAATVIYLSSGRRDPFFCLTAWGVLGVTGGLVLCFATWVVFGGWGPPVPHFFGLLGLMAGGGVAFLTWRRNHQNPYCAPNTSARGM